MRILFDLTGTVFGALDNTMRPDIRETIEELRVGGHRVSFWTSGRVEEMERLLCENNMEGAVYSKSESLAFEPDLCIDDHPEDWMPGRVFAVETHICEELPGSPIDPGCLITFASSKKPGAEPDGAVIEKDIERYLFGKQAGD